VPDDRDVLEDLDPDELYAAFEARGRGARARAPRTPDRARESRARRPLAAGRRHRGRPRGRPALARRDGPRPTSPPPVSSACSASATWNQSS